MAFYIQDTTPNKRLLCFFLGTSPLNVNFKIMVTNFTAVNAVTFSDIYFAFIKKKLNIVNVCLEAV